ncbi:MAG: putative RNA-binding protein YlqC (UPF0109 family) [Verrucomicrobiales bacterium]|jgi:predicted RNA-binding protein YlqC (UPF0109 family)
MDSAEALREFLQFVISQLVEHPEQAAIAHQMDMDENRHIFTVTVAQSDIGRVIGKNGQTVGAMRNLLDAAAHKNRQQASLTIESNERSD